MEIKKLFEKLPFKALCEKVPALASVAPMANYITSGIIAVVLGIIIAACAGGKDDDINRLKKAVFNYDKSLTFDQAVKGMKNAKKARYYKQKDEKGRNQVVVEITIDDAEKFFFPSMMYNQQLYPSDTSGADFDETITDAFITFGKSASYSGDEAVELVGIDYETAVKYVNDLTEWNKEHKKYAVNSKERYFVFNKAIIKGVVTFEGKGKKRSIRLTDGLLSFEIKTVKNEKIDFRIPLEDGDGLFPMIYKDKSMVDAIQE